MDIYQILLQISMKINNFILALHNKIFHLSQFHYMYICTQNSQYVLFFISLKKHNSTAEITLSKITEMCQCDTNAPASRNFKTQNSSLTGHLLLITT